MQIHSTKKDIKITAFTSLKVSVCVNRSVNEIGITATVGNGNVILLCADMPLNPAITDSKNHAIALTAAMEYLVNNYGDYFDFKEMKVSQQFDHAISFVHDYDILSEEAPLIEITFMNNATDKEIILQTFDVNHAMASVNERYKAIVSSFYAQAKDLGVVYTNVKIGNDFVFMKCELIK